MKYTFNFYGEINVEAENEEDAYNIADGLVAPSCNAYDNSENFFIGDLELVNIKEDEEKENTRKPGMWVPVGGFDEFR